MSEFFTVDDGVRAVKRERESEIDRDREVI